MDTVEHIPLLPKSDGVSHSRRNQMFAIFGGASALLSTGTVAGFSAVALPSFLEPNSDIFASEDELSWIASMANVGCIIGNVMGGLLSDLIGRKRSIIFSCLIFFTGWLVIARASSVPAILTGRILNGWAAGLVAPSVQVYICEVADTSTRGSSGTVASLTVTLGILLAYIFGSVLDWSIVALTCSIIPMIVVFYVFILLPESPTWLVSKGHDLDAIKALTWLRQSLRKSQEEFQSLKDLVKNRQIKSRPQNFGGGGSPPRKFSFLRRLCEWSVVQPFLIGTTLFFIQSFSGIYVIVSYSTLIFRYADPFFNEYLQTVCMGFVRLFSIIAAILFIESFRRRTLLMVSAFFMFVSNGILGGHFYMKEMNNNFISFIQIKNITQSGIDPYQGSQNGEFEWVPLTCILVFMIAYSAGFANIPWFLIAELLPADVRSVCCAVAFAMGQIFFFMTVKTFLNFVDGIGAGCTFWIYSGMSLVGVGFVYFFVPETGNLSDAQIEGIFEGKDKNEVTT